MVGSRTQTTPPTCCDAGMPISASTSALSVPTVASAPTYKCGEWEGSLRWR